MRKFEETFKRLAVARSLLRGPETNVIKKSLGDSTKNNRTLTVSQVQRYLTFVGAYSTVRLIQASLTILTPYILKARKNRTDAIDFNELVTTYRIVVMNKKKFRREIGIAVGRALNG